MKDRIYTIILSVAFLLALIICVILFWPTLYRYDEIIISSQKMPVRFNRISGYAEKLSQAGWQEIKTEPAIKELPKEEKNKIAVADCGSTDKTHFEIAVYNGSSWTLKKIGISLKLSELYLSPEDHSVEELIKIAGGPNNTPIAPDKIKRMYETSIDIKPFSTGSFFIKVMSKKPIEKGFVIMAAPIMEKAFDYKSE